MATLHIYRLTLVAPVARHAAINLRIRNNLNPDGGDWLTGNLSASGNAPATHGWFSAGLDARDIKDFMQALAAAAGLTPLANWDTRTRAQKKTWYTSNAAAILSATGIRYAINDNDGVWSSTQALLTAAELKVIRGEI